MDVLNTVRIAADTLMGGDSVWGDGSIQGVAQYKSDRPTRTDPFPVLCDSWTWTSNGPYNYPAARGPVRSRV